MVKPMQDADDTERDLRLELMRLDRTLKRQDLRLRNQQIAYGPIKVVFLAIGLVLVLLVGLIIVS